MPIPPTVRAGVLAVALALLLPTRGVAVECPVIAGGSPALADIDATARLNFIQARLDRDGYHARLWQRGWLIGFGAAFVGQLAVVPAFPYSLRWQLYIGAAKTAVGIGAAAIGPVHAAVDDRQLREWPAQHSGSDVCAVLHEAEWRLTRSADEERLGRSLLLQAGGWALNLAGSLVLGFVFHQWVEAGLSLAEGLVVGEAFVLTRPDGAEAALSQYRTGKLDSTGVRVSLTGTGFVVTF